MTIFPDPPKAFNYLQSTMHIKRQGSLVNILGPDDEAPGHAATVQVVDENQLFRNGLLGFALYLAFDPESNMNGDFKRFKKYATCVELDSIPTADGTPCFALRLGKGIDAPR